MRYQESTPRMEPPSHNRTGIHGDELEGGDLIVEAADLGRLDQTGKAAAVQDEIHPV